MSATRLFDGAFQNVLHTLFVKSQIWVYSEPPTQTSSFPVVVAIHCRAVGVVGLLENGVRKTYAFD